MNPEHVVIVTGLSGSGKTTVIKTMEDLGFFCVDNLPLPLLDKILFLTETRPEISRVCIGIDVREGPMLETFSSEVGNLKAQGQKLDILYLESAAEALERRYSETRRRHPLQGPGEAVRPGIDRETGLLADIKPMADLIIDTTDLTVHDVRALITRTYDRTGTSTMAVDIISFGFRYGIPRDASYVFDCRFLTNPHFDEKLKPLTGAHREVVQFMEDTPEWATFIDNVIRLLKFSLPLHQQELRPLVTVAFGCTGGRHRSVAAAETVAKTLENEDFRVRVAHRNLEVAAQVDSLKNGTGESTENNLEDRLN